MCATKISLTIIRCLIVNTCSTAKSNAHEDFPVKLRYITFFYQKSLFFSYKLSDGCIIFVGHTVLYIFIVETCYHLYTRFVINFKHRTCQPWHSWYKEIVSHNIIRLNNIFGTFGEAIMSQVRVPSSHVHKSSLRSYFYDEC